MEHQSSVKVHCAASRSGKEIKYILNTQVSEAALDFGNIDDNFDAYAVFRYMIQHEVDVGRSEEFRRLFLGHALLYLGLLARGGVNLREYERSLGIENDTDLLVFGKERMIRRTR